MNPSELKNLRLLLSSDTRQVFQVDGKRGFFSAHFKKPFTPPYNSAFLSLVNDASIRAIGSLILISIWDETMFVFCKADFRSEFLSMSCKEKVKIVEKASKPSKQTPVKAKRLKTPQKDSKDPRLDAVYTYLEKYPYKYVRVYGEEGLASQFYDTKTESCQDKFIDVYLKAEKMKRLGTLTTLITSKTPVLVFEKHVQPPLSYPILRKIRLLIRAHSNKRIRISEKSEFMRSHGKDLEGICAEDLLFYLGSKEMSRVGRVEEEERRLGNAYFFVKN